MKRLLFSLFLLLFVNKNIAQTSSNFSDKLSALQQLIQNTHFNPKPINDSLSKGVFDLFLEKLDSDKRFFTADDIEKFKLDEFLLDDYIIKESFTFINKYEVALINRIGSSRQILETLYNKQLDYSGKDIARFTPKDLQKYHENEDSFKNYWNKRIRYKIVDKLIEEDSILNIVKSNFKSKEPIVKAKIIQQELCSLDELLNKSGGLKQFVEDAFLDAYANYQDPNTMYFTNSEKVEFETYVAKNQEIFGVVTSKNKEGDIIVAYVIPGSPAFKNGNIEVNDIVQSISTKKSSLEMLCISNADVEAFINNESHKTLSFKLKKQNGSIQKIELTKSKTKIEDNSIISYIISGNENDLGYISIPSFYTDLESIDGLGVANDIAKELYKLEKENINGLIIDLRYNGGGSMVEASDLSGMFINRGPLSVVKGRNDETYTIKDLNRGSLFTKPMVVLINEYSASASEFFASVMQDYNRAIIVGSESYGKSTVQVILPLDDFINLGFCKVTVEKFYRPTGQSNQYIGVVPDIKLPSLYDGFEMKERHTKYALKNDSVSVTLKPIPLKRPNLKPILQKSQERIANNSLFKLVKHINKQGMEYLNKTEDIPISIDNIYNYKETRKKLWESIERLDNNKTSIRAKNITSTLERLNYDKSEMEDNKQILENLSKDIYIEESYNILNNYINQNTTN